MKNIFLIQTKNPSKLYKIKDKLFFEEYPNKTVNVGNQNIYITNDEEIKEGYWYYHLERKTIHNTLEKVDYFVNNTKYDKFKKIILTTDQDLIKNGIQSINDEFLRWFVNNPTCEEVEVKKEYITPLGDIVETCYDNERLNYKIIISKEKKCTCKEHDPYCCQIHGNCPTCVKKEPKQICEYCKIEISKYGCACGEKPKQETLEEEKVIDLIQFLSMNQNFNKFSSLSKETAKLFLKEFKKK